MSRSERRGADVAVDLGTATTQVFLRGSGAVGELVVDEPTVVALDGRGRSVAVGADADAADDRSLVRSRPIGRSAVRDVDSATALLRAFLQRAGVARRSRPRVVLSVPCSASPVEQRAWQAVGREAGGGEVVLVDAPRAAALGAGVALRPLGTMVVDVGAGTTEAAVLGLGRVVAFRAIRLGLGDLDAAVQDRLRRHHGLAVGEATASAVRCTLGAAARAPSDAAAEVRGRAVATGSPATAVLEATEVHEALADGLEAVEATALACLAAVPAELARDLTHAGLYLVGGGGLLPGLAERLAAATDLPVHVPAEPWTSAARGGLRAAAVSR